jgi:hypothetical protein
MANDIEKLIERYQHKIVKKEAELNELRANLESAQQTLKLLLAEGLVHQEEIPGIQNRAVRKAPIKPIDDKYTDTSLPDAIVDILEGTTKTMSGVEIYRKVMLHGFNSDSSNIKRDVFVNLYRLTKKGRIGQTEEESIKKYYIPMGG